MQKRQSAAPPQNPTSTTEAQATAVPKTTETTTPIARQETAPRPPPPTAAPTQGNKWDEPLTPKAMEKLIKNPPNKRGKRRLPPGHQHMFSWHITAPVTQPAKSTTTTTTTTTSTSQVLTSQQVSMQRQEPPPPPVIEHPPVSKHIVNTNLAEPFSARPPHSSRHHPYRRPGGFVPEHLSHVLPMSTSTRYSLHPPPPPPPSPSPSPSDNRESLSPQEQHPSTPNFSSPNSNTW